MNRSKIVAIITGAISIILALAYLVVVQLLDFRGEMLPAPQSQMTQSTIVATGTYIPFGILDEEILTCGITS